MQPNPEFQKLDAHLNARDSHLSLDSDKMTARCPVFNRKDIPALPSQVAYVACQTLRSLATADTEVLWEVYGDIISGWPGPESNAQSIEQTRDEERSWVKTYREKDSKDMTQTISNIRLRLATACLKHVPTISLISLATYLSTSTDIIDTFDRVLALHHRSNEDEDTIFILPFLPRVEYLIGACFNSPSKTSCMIDALVVSTAKAIVHESRHMVGTLIHGVSYLTPPMVQRAFRQEEVQEEAVQGEAGDWYDASRYGAFHLCPSLVSPTDSGPIETTTLVLTGHINDRRGLRYLVPSAVADWAQHVRDGLFITSPHRYFITDYTLPVIGWVRDLEHLDAQNPDGPTVPIQTQSHHTSSAGPSESGSHTVLWRSMKPVKGITDARELGYSNLRGVIMDRSQ
ncbi:hypothetical protein GGX14DRAFT_614769 [Mycena pura]|uniref:Uncharacterized protein n=1 Tax=Mycena pura TaxID=153505 RepID=A0AAD6YTD4_9AGAR|nr:hypothetical protein GGX14DRAFT_614769 [Mycena pura]